jgi:hypothetical protein
MTTNKDFKDFINDMKNSRQENLDEGVWDVVKGAAKTVGRFLGPAATAIQGYDAYQKYQKGDYPGAALSAAGAVLPGPLGWAATGASIARDQQKDDEPETPKAPETPKPAEPETPKAPEPTSEPLNYRKVKTTIEKESGGKKIKSFKQFHKNK